MAQDLPNRSDSSDSVRKNLRRDNPRMHTAEFSALTSADLIEAGIDPNDPLLAKPGAKKQLSFWQGMWFVALGGALGGLLRYLVGLKFPTSISFTLVDVPWGTLLINFFGCLILGFLTGLVEVRPNFDERLKLLVGTGFCGGFTTMSTFALENAVLFGSNHLIQAMEYIALTVLLCMFAVTVGFILGKKIPQPKAKAQIEADIFSPHYASMLEVPSTKISSNHSETKNSQQGGVND